MAAAGRYNGMVGLWFSVILHLKPAAYKIAETETSIDFHCVCHMLHLLQLQSSR